MADLWFVKLSLILVLLHLRLWHRFNERLQGNHGVPHFAECLYKRAEQRIYVAILDSLCLGSCLFLALFKALLKKAKLVRDLDHLALHLRHLLNVLVLFQTFVTKRFVAHLHFLNPAVQLIPVRCHLIEARLKDLELLHFHTLRFDALLSFDQLELGLLHLNFLLHQLVLELLDLIDLINVDVS